MEAQPTVQKHNALNSISLVWSPDSVEYQRFNYETLGVMKIIENPLWRQKPAYTCILPVYL